MLDLLKQAGQKGHGYILKPVLEENCDDMGHVAAGHLLKLIDVVGTIPAYHHLGDEKAVLVTASLDRTNFVQPIHVWEFMAMESRLTRVWKSSLEAQVVITAFNFRQRESVPRHIATAYLVYVCLDARKAKIPLPLFQPASDDGKLLVKEADLRRANRFQEEQEIPHLPFGPEDAPHWVETIRRMNQQETNIQGNVFGGVIMEIIANTGQKAAERQALGAVATGVRMDRTHFIAPSFVGETIRARAMVTRTWTTSMEVQVEVDAMNPNQPDHPRRVATSYLIFVRLNDMGRPADLPPWHPQTEIQEARSLGADKRRDFRDQEAQQNPEAENV